MKKLKPGLYVNRLDNLVVVYPDHTADVWNFNGTDWRWVRVKVPYDNPARHWQIKLLKPLEVK